MSDDRLGEIAKLLIHAGSDINAKSSDLGEVSHQEERASRSHYFSQCS